MRRRADERGFTTVELMIVVLIIGILMALALPVYRRARAQSSWRTCLANQRVLEGAATTWLGLGQHRDLADLAGVVDGAHPVVVDHVVGSPPTCPSAPSPADPDNPTSAEGAYTFNADGTVQSCPHGDLGAHGHY
jgi:type IV pilus assembly protein PilA